MLQSRLCLKPNECIPWVAGNRFQLTSPCSLHRGCSLMRSCARCGCGRDGTSSARGHQLSSRYLAEESRYSHVEHTAHVACGA